MSAPPRKLMNGPQAAGYGCIVSFENHDGLELTLHRAGPLVAGLRSACADALAVDSTFRVTCYSTPQTIYDDVHGRTAYVNGREGWDGSRNENAMPVYGPENYVLGRAKLGHLAHPRLGYHGANL